MTTLCRGFKLRSGTPQVCQVANALLISWSGREVGAGPPLAADHARRGSGEPRAAAILCAATVLMMGLTAI